MKVFKEGCFRTKNAITSCFPVLCFSSLSVAKCVSVHQVKKVILHVKLFVVHIMESLILQF